MKNNLYWFLVISYLACIALTSCSHTDAIPATNSSYAAEDIFIGIAEILLEPSAVIATVYLPLTSEWVSIVTDSGTGEYGIEDLAGQTIIPAVYDYLTIIEDNNYVLAIEKGKYGLLDLSGEQLIPFDYDLLVVNRISDNKVYLLAGYQDRYGFLDFEGNVVIPPIYDISNPYQDGYASVQLDGKWGFINCEGTVVIPIQCQDYRSFDNGIAFVRDRETWYLLDCEIMELIPIEGEPHLVCNRDQILITTKQGLYGALNRYGEVLARPVYQEYSILVDFDVSQGGYPFGYELVLMGTPTLMLGTSELAHALVEYGERPSRYISYVKEGRAPVQKTRNGLWGYLDASGREIVPPRYQQVYPYNEGRAFAERDDSVFLLDLDGNELVNLVCSSPNEFKESYEYYTFYEGYAIIQSKGLFGFINRDGLLVTPCVYDSATRFRNGRALVIRDGQKMQLCIKNHDE